MHRHLCHATLWASSFAASLSIGLACRGENDAHCFYNEGDATCADRYTDGSRPFCATGCMDSPGDDGCVAQRPDDDACYSPCGGEKTAEECDGVADTGSGSTVSDGPTTMPTNTGEPTTDDMTTMGSVSGTMTSGETETDSATTSGGCASSEDCTELDAPICENMACVPCTTVGDGDAACAAKDPNAPACRDDGQCVQCTSLNDAACEDTTPICDPGTNACLGCNYHTQCDVACDVVTGACLDDVPVLYVDGDNGSCDDGGAGTMAMPFCNIQPGIDSVADGDSAVIFVAALGGASNYTENLTIDGNKTIALLSSSGRPAVTPSGGGSTLTLTGANTHLYVEGVRFASNNSAVALSLSAGEIVLDRVEVVQNALNGSGILLQTGAHLRLRNSVLGANGDIDGPTYGVLADDGTFDILYSTLARNRSTVPSSIRCTNGGGGTVRNSIVVSDQPAGGSIDCAGIDISNSALDEAVAGNMNVGNYQAAWFAVPASGDFHLTGTGEGVFSDIAVWESGDPPVDLDGEARPTSDGTADFAGADLVP